MLSPMCMICDGATPDEALFHIHGVIHRYGWFIQYVQHRKMGRSWGYTIGLSDGFDHPELVVAGLDMKRSTALLNAAGEKVRQGKRLAPTERYHLCGVDTWVGVSPVHPNHFDRGVLAVWDEYYGALGPPYPPAEALEIVPARRRPQLLLPESPIGER